MTSFTAKRAWLVAGIASAALVGGATAASAAQAINGQLNVVANSTINNATVTQVSNQSWNTVPATLNATATALATAPGFNADHADHISTFGTAQATWASANSGEVDFTNYGWDISVNNPDNSNTQADLTQNRGGADWSYTFTATANGQFVMDYSVSSLSSNGFGLWGWEIDASGGGVGGPVLSPFSPNASGQFVGALAAGQTYTVELNGNPNISGVFGDLNQGMNGEFDWSISEGGVPEPASWALMLTGFFGLGGALRARRRTAAGLA